MKAIDAIIEEIRKDGEQTRNQIERMMELIEQLSDGLSFEEQMQEEVNEPEKDEPEQLNGVFRNVNGETKLVKFHELQTIVNAYAEHDGRMDGACNCLRAVYDIHTTPKRLSTFISQGRLHGYVGGYKSDSTLTDKFWDELEGE